MTIPSSAASSPNSQNKHTIPRSSALTPTFNDDQDNYHRIEFEAPLSAELEAQHYQSFNLQQEDPQVKPARFSIDLSLELERQLAMESPPITPASPSDPVVHASLPSINIAPAVPQRVDSRINDLSPDPEILAHIVTQLRQSLEDMTRERDDLLKLLATANSRKVYAEDALQLMSDKATAAGEEMEQMKKRMKEDEEQIVLLRAKVEESRRGLMRLQTENRRQNMAPIDVARASSSHFTAFTSPPSAKRSSFVPLTGRPNSHNRFSSVSDLNFGGFPTPDMTPSPNVHAFNISSDSSSNNHRFSGLFSRPSPPEGDSLHSAPATTGRIPSPEPSHVVAELVSIRKELQIVKDELETTKHELMEAKEAKEASETCVSALREFIAEYNIGVGGGAPSAMKLPLPPTMTTGEETSADEKKTNSGWGFKLWGNGESTPLRSSAVSQSASVASPVPPSVPQTQSTTPTIGAAPLSRKLGGFFSSRSSVSSSHSSLQQSAAPLSQLPQLQTNAATLKRERDSVYSYSDVSSVAEPISPGSDINGLGTAVYDAGTPIAKLKASSPNLPSEGGPFLKDSTNSEVNSVHVSLSSVDLNGLR